MEVLPGEEGAEGGIDVGVGLGDLVEGLFDFEAEALVGDIGEAFLHPDLFGDFVGEDLTEEVGRGELLIDAGAELFEFGAGLDAGESEWPGLAGGRGLVGFGGGSGAPGDGGVGGIVVNEHKSDLHGRVSGEGEGNLP